MTLVQDFTPGERWVDGGVHVLGVGLSVAATVGLLHQAISFGEARSVVAASIYGGGLLTSFGFSAAYNLFRSRVWSGFLRLCDHAAIYLLIAGTFTPFALTRLDGALHLAPLAVVWATAIFGVTLKFARPRRFERVSLALYLALGWASAVGVFAAGAPTASLLFLLAGGVLYSVGVIFLSRTGLRFHNAIWHGFVLAATACHCAAVSGQLAG